MGAYVPSTEAVDRSNEDLDLYGNATAENFWNTLKNELIYKNSFQTRDQVRTDIFEYIEVFYSRTRRHTAIGNLSPVDFELLRAKAA